MRQIGTTEQPLAPSSDPPNWLIYARVHRSGLTVAAAAVPGVTVLVLVDAVRQYLPEAFFNTLTALPELLVGCLLVLARPLGTVVDGCAARPVIPTTLAVLLVQAGLVLAVLSSTRFLLAMERSDWLLNLCAAGCLCGLLAPLGRWVSSSVLLALYAVTTELRPGLFDPVVRAELGTVLNTLITLAAAALAVTAIGCLSHPGLRLLRVGSQIWDTNEHDL